MVITFQQWKSIPSFFLHDVYFILMGMLYPDPALTPVLAPLLQGTAAGGHPARLEAHTNFAMVKGS